jgi:hypothetical protein
VGSGESLPLLFEVTDSSDDVLRGRNDATNVIKAADRATEFVASWRLVGDPFEDVGRPSYLSVGRDRRSRRASRIHPRIALTSSSTRWQGIYKVATDKGLLRTGWTADEFKGKGSRGVVVTDVVGVA